MPKFVQSETGAVTVDWVVLTAGLVGLGLAVMQVVSIGVQDVSVDIQDQLESDSIIRSSFACQQGESGCTYWYPPAADVQCEEGVQDCGVNFFPWIAGSYEAPDGTTHFVNDQNQVIDHDNGDLLPIEMWITEGGDGGFTDAAGRAVDQDGVPL